MRITLRIGGDSIVYMKIRGFEKIPFAKIGPHELDIEMFAPYIIAGFVQCL